jgi:hypothetical protein
MRPIHLFCAAIVLASAAGAEAVEPATPVAVPCTAPEYRQFDFWIGDWDTFESGAKEPQSVARNHVDAILGGCALREVYAQNDGLLGESYTAWDPVRRQWHQTWVTNRGELLLLDGRREGRRIVLAGADHTPKGERQVRAWWQPDGDAVREHAEVSTDHGKTWSPLFDIVFRRHERAG